jgi:hypothetical protein
MRIRKDPEPRVLVYSVILDGLPLNAETSDKQRAKAILADTCKKLGCKEPAVFWNGDAGKFEAWLTQEERSEIHKMIRRGIESARADFQGAR